MEDKKFKEIELATQHSIPNRLQYLCVKYPSITWLQAAQLYDVSVDTVLHLHKVSVLSDISFGQGYIEVRDLFEQMLKNIENYNIKVRGDVNE
jgi:hypothetical protein